MIIKKIILENFRNYINQEINFNNNINLFVGENAQGKTNIIESIYVCALSKTYRTPKDIDTINLDKDYYRITMFYEIYDEDKKIELFLDKLGHKQIKVDDVKITKVSNIIGDIPIVIFSPDDINMIKGSPSDRRKFIDNICCQISKSYTLHLQEYNKYLKIKNNLLKNDLSQNEIEYMKILNENISKHIKLICNFRERVVNELNKYSTNIQKELTNDKEILTLKYISDFIGKDEEGILDILNKHIQIDIYKKCMVKGIQKDDIEFYINGLNVEKYGSQGQARTCLLTLKLSNFEILKLVKKTNPILLLDDIMSELDSSRVKYLLNYISKYQSVITTTDSNDINNIENIKIVKISNGSLQ